MLGAAGLVASAVLLGSPGKPLTVHDKAYYANPALANFVRPGLVINVFGAEIAADGTIKASFRLTDPKGQPLDRQGVTTPGPVSVSFIAAYIPKGATQYTAYTVRPQTSPITGATAVQASTDSGGVFAKTADGEYTYTFKTRAPQGFDTSVTHTIGAYGSRDLREFDMGTNYADAVYNFVPNGSAVTVVRDVVRTASCNKCHDQMAFHGGPRRSMELCVLCHQPQSVDPDTGNSVDMVVMTHKIHMGSALPSVIAGKPYQIIGHGQSVNDYSKIVFPADPRNCAACHEPGATQADNVYKANRTACGACHDNVDFNTGKNHLDLPQLSDNQCTNCHIIKGELDFDASITGAHLIPKFSSSLKGVVFQILKVDGAPGKSPTVTFSLKDKSGAPIAASGMARLNLILSGPNTDYATYVSEDARKATAAGDGTYSYTFAKTVPADGKGSWTISIEGRRDPTLLPA
ncbi:MAG: OmcA/MtrC family decaheme c-type cytochrome, partial [Acidobacteria bacterium]|nr:OmcA/MtrC family decaheme c-type cytochrome [Acidobacteriota bacterium]